MLNKYFILLSTLPLLSGFISSNKSVISVSAIEDEEKTIYVDCSLNAKFLEEGANPYLHYNNGVTVDVPLTPINDGVYKTSLNIPLEVFANESYSFDIRSFDASIDDYLTIGIKGGNLLKEANYNYICLDSYIEASKTEIKGYGYYGDRTPNPDATYKTQRVWLYNNYPNFYNNDEWGEPCKNVIGYFNKESKYELIEMKSILNLYNSETYYYADIPYDNDSVYLTRMSQKKGHSYLVYENVYFETIMHGVCYAPDLLNEKYTLQTTTIYGADAMVLKHVCEAYLTYGKDNSNGATGSAITALFNTWFKNKSASTSDLKEIKLLDYTGYAANGNSYEGLTKNASFSVNEKWNTICSQAGIDPYTGEFRSFDFSFLGSKEMKILLLLAVVAVILAILLFVYLIDKNRRDNLNEEDPNLYIERKRVFLFFKRLFDICFSLIAIVLCAIFLWWWITIINIFVTKGHPFFAPKRLGRHKKVFKMYKFRSMKIDAPVIPPYEMSDKEREELETPFGKFLRKTSLDETLQFINVLFGQMSIVGPRPGASEHEDMLIEARDSYHPSAFDIRPGITGYSQVYMKRQHDVMSKAWFDSEYVKIMSFVIDVKIILHTFLFIKGK